MQIQFSEQRFPYILGLDLGTTSLGWAIIDTANGTPKAIRRCGVRIFDAGVEGSIEQGKDASRAAARREARLARRQLWRRAQRARKVFAKLQELDLLPASESNDSADRHAVLHALDQQLRTKYPIADSPTAAHLLPYQLRARAASEPLQPDERHELGRALFHLAQRRGYLSNRKAAEKTDEEEGVVKKGIGEIAAQLNGRTLGQYFATLNPLERRIRQRWTAREMYLDEFNRICDVQAAAFGLSDDNRRSLFKAIFFQRPLKSQKGLVGKCELEPNRRRAPMALPIAQQARILQSVNHLRVRFPDGEMRELSLDEKRKLYEALDAVSEMSLAEARKLLGNEFRRKGTQFTLEESGEKKLLGNRTRARLEPIFGERWAAMSDDERDRIVLEVLHFQKPSALERRAINAWGLARENAERLSEVRLEADHARHSVPALNKLVERMRNGLPYATARKEAYPQTAQSGDPLDILPPILSAKPDLRNPAVCRALTELRKVVNAIIRRYGKPEKIRIELARDLKKSRKERKLATDRIREQTKKREAAVKKIMEHIRGFAPKRGYDPAVEKVLLAEECNWRCPFTNQPISMAALVGSNPHFDVAHIYPRRYLDDSFANKTLCYHEINRHRMHDLLPFQAFGASTEPVNGVLSWKEILSNVRAFQGPGARIKLERFERAEVPEDFVASQLNDTRYNSVVAAEYLGLLYGGLSDGEGIRRIEPITGGITALLRTCWDLYKSRDDHRHHALDAVVLALTDPGTVAQLQRQAEIASARGVRLTKVDGFPPPWPGFVQQVEERLNEINVSFRMDHRLGGALHAATNYSRPIVMDAGKSIVRHLRTPLRDLTVKEITGDAIVDPVIRRLVQEKFAELGGGDPKKLFVEPMNHPALMAKDGRKIPIHRVRVRVGVKPKTVGKGITVRHIASGQNSNHHVAIVAVLDAKGKEIKWVEHIVSRLEANARQSKEAKARGETIIERNYGPGRRFKFSMMPNDFLSIVDENGLRQLYRVANISAGDHELRLHTDARESTELRKYGQRIRMTSEKLWKGRAFKVVVSPLGDWVQVRE